MVVISRVYLTLAGDRVVDSSRRVCVYQIVFMPKGARPIFGRPKHAPLAVEHPLRKPLNQHVLSAVQADPDDSTMYD